MKTVLRGIIVNTFALWGTSQIVAGFRISGGIDVLLFAGAVLTLMNLLIKPVLSVLTLPLNLITLGLFSWVLNVVMLYLLTVVVSQITLAQFTFQGLTTPLLSIPKLTLSPFQTAIVSAFMLSFISNFLFWLFRR